MSLRGVLPQKDDEAISINDFYGLLRPDFIGTRNDRNSS